MRTGHIKTVFQFQTTRGMDLGEPNEEGAIQGTGSDINPDFKPHS